MKIKSLLFACIISLTATSAYAASRDLCSINYSCGDGATGTPPRSPSINTATKVFKTSAPGTCAKDGYTFSHWLVSSTSTALQVTDNNNTAYPETKYTIPFTSASALCNNSGTVRIVLTAQWLDVLSLKTATSKKYVDDELAKKQPQFQGLGNNKLMLYSNTTDGAVVSRDIVTELGSSTSATSVPTIGAINTGLVTKQNTLNGKVGWVVENTGTAGNVKARPVYSTTDNYKTALVEAEDLNQTIIDAVNSELTQVADGWRISDSVTLPTLRTLWNLDASINGTNICYRRLSGATNPYENGCSATTQATLGAAGNKSGKWGVVMPYGDIAGKSVCSAMNIDISEILATEAQGIDLTAEFNAQTGVGESALSSDQYICWCKMESVAGESVVSRWWYHFSYGTTSACADNCADRCAADIENLSDIRSSVFGSLQW